MQRVGQQGGQALIDGVQGQEEFRRGPARADQGQDEQAGQRRGQRPQGSAQSPVRKRRGEVEIHGLKGKQSQGQAANEGRGLGALVAEQPTAGDRQQEEEQDDQLDC